MTAIEKRGTGDHLRQMARARMVRLWSDPARKEERKQKIREAMANRAEIRPKLLPLVLREALVEEMEQITGLTRGQAHNAITGLGENGLPIN